MRNKILDLSQTQIAVEAFFAAGKGLANCSIGDVEKRQKMMNTNNKQ